MEDIILQYRRWIEIISEEEQQAVRCFQGDLLEMYKRILNSEREKIEQQINKILYY